MKSVKKFSSPVRTRNSTRNCLSNEKEGGVRRERRGGGNSGDGGGQIYEDPNIDAGGDQNMDDDCYE